MGGRVGIKRGGGRLRRLGDEGRGARLGGGNRSVVADVTAAVEDSAMPAMPSGSLSLSLWTGGVKQRDIWGGTDGCAPRFGIEVDAVEQSAADDM